MLKRVSFALRTVRVNAGEHMRGRHRQTRHQPQELRGPGGADKKLFVIAWGNLRQLDGVRPRP